MPNPNRRESLREEWKGRFHLIHGLPDDMNDDHNLSDKDIDLDADWWLAKIDQEVEDAEKKSFEEGFKQGREFGANETIQRINLQQKSAHDQAK